MSKIEVDKVDPQSGTALEIGTSGDTVTVPSGVGLTLTDSTLLLPTTINTDKLDPKSGTALEIGTSGDTITVPTGAGLTVTDEVKTNKISPATGVAFALGDSGDTFTIPSGATITNNGTATGFAGGVGIDQTWQDVIGSRALNVYYTNSTGGPIQVFIIGGDIGNSGDIKFYYTPDGGSEIIGTGLYTNSAGGREQMTFTVPDGDQYKCYGAGTAALVQWWELS